ncbi:MAG TPA: preprotein translocase subunit YajC [Planctomycetaceae bacterium]|nr:preprotein translocase subunit YajC [Planctomycetaceae bacterium]
MYLGRARPARERSVRWPFTIPDWGITVANQIWQGLILLGQDDPTSGFMQIALLVLPIGLFFYLFLIRPQRREQAERQKMLDAVKKNDRVVTIGGVYGVVANVNKEANEITVKVDEATNTKLRLTLGSIARVLGDESVKS